MSKRVTVVRQKAKPGKRDELRRVWEKYARQYAEGSNGVLSAYYCYRRQRSRNGHRNLARRR